MTKPDNRPMAHPQPADLTAVTALLSEAAHGLLTLSKPPETKDEPKKETVLKDAIRCYRFSPLAIPVAKGCCFSLFPASPFYTSTTPEVAVKFEEKRRQPPHYAAAESS